jgi:hypothetical protein
MPSRGKLLQRGCKENFRPLAAEGNAKHWTHLDYLQRPIEGEVAERQDRTILRFAFCR